MKQCSMCLEVKPESEFNKKGQWLQARCRACQREWYNNYYHNSPNELNRLRNKNKAVKQESRDLIQSLKDVPCMDCGVKYEYFVMDFDHRGDKLFNVGSMTTMSKEKILEEVAKCDVVCSNCHRIRTHSFRIGGIGKPT